MLTFTWMDFASRRIGELTVTQAEANRLITWLSELNHDFHFMVIVQ